MAKITWDTAGTRLYEIGCDHGVFYSYKEKKYTDGVAWNGLVSVTDSPSGADENKFYADNIVYGSLRGTEDFGGTIECYTYPDEFALSNGLMEIAPGVTGNQQYRKQFGLSYRTNIGNETDGIEHAYKYHLVYNATVSPSEMQYSTINDSPEPGTISFEFACNPVTNTIGRPMSHVEISSDKVDADKLTAFLDTIYGTDDKVAELPGIEEVAAAFAA